MRRYVAYASAVRLALMLALAAVVAAVVPSLLTADSPSTAVLASLAVAVVVVVRMAGLVAVPSLFAPAHRLAETAEAPLHRPGRVTDPVHHPIRPRAPGV